MAAGVLISGCCHSSRVLLLLLLVCRVAVSARGQLAYEQLLAHCPPPRLRLRAHTPALSPGRRDEEERGLGRPGTVPTQIPRLDLARGVPRQV